MPPLAIQILFSVAVITLGALPAVAMLVALGARLLRREPTAEGPRVLPNDSLNAPAR
ncbi:MAG: hypothetical protein KC731_34615 [Myxococcales bacterium]|nr:hypothetical protein [Myxococcales bacterium]